MDGISAQAASKTSEVSPDPSEVTMSILDGLDFTESLRAVAELETFLKVQFTCDLPTTTVRNNSESECIVISYTNHKL